MFEEAKFVSHFNVWHVFVEIPALKFPLAPVLSECVLYVNSSWTFCHMKKFSAYDSLQPQYLLSTFFVNLVLLQGF